MKSRFLQTLIMLFALALTSCSDDDNVNEITVQSVTLDSQAATLNIGESLQLNVSVSPSDAIDKTVKWTSSASEIAIVDNSGNVTALSVGTATITATAGNVSAHCEITVNPISVTGITINPATLKMEVGQTVTIHAELTPENPTYPTVTWGSTDENIVTVSANGEVTAHNPGKAYITAEADGLFAAPPCEVTVTAPINASIGDIYYSDGTVSTELDGTKLPIGIVFWVGDPTESDPTLKREHPDCTNGLVMALNDVTNVCWQPRFVSYGSTISSWVEANAPQYISLIAGLEQSSNLNKIVGYNNTQALKAFNGAEDNKEWPVLAYTAIEQYASKVPSAETSSGWYLPSIKELALIFCGDYNGNILDDLDPDLFESLNIAMKKCPGYTALDKYNDYLSSSEKNTGAIFDYTYGYVAPEGCGKGLGNAIVRPVLAF